MGRKVQNLIGQQFGQLRVLKRGRGVYSTWICVCVCEEGTEVRGINLTSGKTKSCGCLKKQTQYKVGITRVALPVALPVPLPIALPVPTKKIYQPINEFELLRARIDEVFGPALSAPTEVEQPGKQKFLPNKYRSLYFSKSQGSTEFEEGKLLAKRAI